MSLEALEKKIERDLEMVNYPPKAWRFEETNVYDVAIIGAGMAGMAAAFSLMRQGIMKIQLFDAGPQGKEGPWATSARMKTLRSPKIWMGPALNLPNLTFCAWFEAQFETEGWKDLGKIPTLQWMDYLKWFRKVLHLPVQNNTALVSILPEKQSRFKLLLSNGEVLCRKVVLATGRGGFGGNAIPSFMQKRPRSSWAHSNELIDFDALRGKRIAVLGGGAAGFDTAAALLEQGAKSVDLFIRRPQLPNVNTERELFYSGCYQGYFQLSDEEKWEIYAHASKKGMTPPREALERIAKCPNFQFHGDADPKEILDAFDYVILGTGFEIDGRRQPELKPFMDDILLWGDRGFSHASKMGRFPYLGSSLEFLEKKKGKAPFLKDIHCFNYAATLSHSTIGGEIPSISIGAERLAEGIARDFFLGDKEKHLEKFKSYDTPEFRYDEFAFFSRSD